MSLNILEINKIISEVWKKAEVLKSLTRREAKEETEKMASKKKMVAFRYDNRKPSDMSAIFDLWEHQTRHNAHMAATEGVSMLIGLWRSGDIQLLLPKSTAMKLISNWEVI